VQAKVARRDPVVEREDVELSLVDLGGDVEAQVEALGGGALAAAAGRAKPTATFRRGLRRTTPTVQEERGAPLGE